MKHILLYTEQPILAIGLNAVLTAADYEVEVVSTVPGLLAQLQAAAADVVLVELSRSVTFDVLHDLQPYMRQRIVLWTETITPEMAWQAMGVGVSGILSRALPVETQFRALNKVMAGELWFAPDLTRTFLQTKRVLLTQREAHLVRLVAEGCRNKEIAGRLHLQLGTVKVYMSRLYAKLHVNGRPELSLYSLRNMGDLVPRDGAPRYTPLSLLMPPLSLLMPNDAATPNV